MKASVVIVLLSVASGAYPAARSASTIRVSSESEFAAAVSALRDSGGTIMLLPHVFAGELVIGPRSSRRLRVVGAPGARVERLLLDHTQRVSLDGLTISPVTADASLTALSSRDVDVHGLQVTAEGTRYSASVALPGSSGVTIRRSVFTHCGDRSPRFVNCLWLRWASDVTVADSWFHDCLGCDFVHGRFGSRLTLVRNRFERTLPCQVGRRRCAHQDPVELFAGRGLRVIGNHFGVYKLGGAQLYLTNAIDDVTIANNVFVGIDPRVPGYRARVGLIVGSSHSPRVPHDVRIVNNTILTGATRTDGYLGSIRLSSRYGGLPRRERPIIANNVIGVLEVPHHVCSEARVSSSNVVLRGHACSGSDRVGAAALDRYGRPTASSRLLIGRADRRYAPATDAAGKPRDPTSGRTSPARARVVPEDEAAGAGPERGNEKPPTRRTYDHAMAYDEELADRIRELIGEDADLSEKKMFGGLAFLIRGNMAVAASGQGGILVRVDPAESDALVETTSAHPMEMRGRQMRGWLRVDSEDVRAERQLAKWVDVGTTYARSLPPEL